MAYYFISSKIKFIRCQAKNLFFVGDQEALCRFTTQQFI